MKMETRGAPSAQSKILLKGGYVLSMDPTIGDLPVGDVLIADGKILDVGRSIDVADAFVVDATDRIILPGFVDTHRHLWEGVLRNALPDAHLGEYFGQVLGVFGPAYTPEDVYTGNLISAVGALNAGITTILDWSHIQNSPEHTDAAIKALLDSRTRAVFAYGPPSRGATPWYADSGHAYPEDLHRLRKGVLSNDSGLVTLAAAVLGPEFEDVEHAKREWQTADALGLRISVHVGVGAAGQFGKLEAFSKIHPLNDRTTYIHCCTLSEAEWKLIADTGGTVSLSPQIDLQMGQGYPAVQGAIDHGIQPSLSVDVETSAPSDMFTQMRSAFAAQRGMALQRASDGHGAEPRLITARDVLRYATIEGARANGLEKRTGSITPGKQADLQLLRTDLVNVMPLNDPYGAVVTSMDTSNVDAVMVAGDFVKWNGSLVGIDIGSLKRSVDQARDRIYAAAGIKR